MAAGRGDRGVDVLLGVGTAVVLAAGGWWWVASAPPPAPAAAQVTGPVADEDVPPLPFDSYVLVDPATGLEVPSDRSGPPEPVQRTVLPLGEGNLVAWVVDVRPNARYLLRYRCDGQGTLALRVGGAEVGPAPGVDGMLCGVGDASFELTARSPRLHVQASKSSADPGGGEVTLQLTLLP